MKFKHQETLEEGETEEPRVKVREVPIVGEDFPTPELFRGKRMDIMRKASYAACDKLASRQLKAIATSFQRP